MNPMSLLRYKSMMEQFQQRHPKFLSFFTYVGKEVKTGSLLEVSLTGPDGKKTVTNIHVTPEDVELIQDVTSMLGKVVKSEN